MKVNPDDFTNNAWQGIIDAKNLALTEKHQTLETEHLFWSLLKKNELAIKVIERSGGAIKNLLTEIEEFIKNQPKMLKAQESIFFGKNISLSISRAKNIQQSFKDNDQLKSIEDAVRILVPRNLQPEQFYKLKISKRSRGLEKTGTEQVMSREDVITDPLFVMWDSLYDRVKSFAEI